MVEAEIVKGLLQSEGIDAHVSGHYLQGGVGDLQAGDLAKVHVEDEDFADARSIVARYEASDFADSD